MVEVLLARSLANAGIPARVHSAGLLPSGRAASEGAQEVMADRGLDLGDHVSTQISPELVASSDLVIGMAREHVREVAVLDPSAFPRTFTLKELVRRGRQVGPQYGDEPLDDWLARLHQGRRATHHLGESSDDDVADPIGQRLARYQRTADELVDLVAALTMMLAVPSPASSQPRSQPTSQAVVADEAVVHLEFTAARSPEETP